MCWQRNAIMMRWKLARDVNSQESTIFVFTRARVAHKEIITEILMVLPSRVCNKVSSRQPSTNTALRYNQKEHGHCYYLMLGNCKEMKYDFSTHRDCWGLYIFNVLLKRDKIKRKEDLLNSLCWWKIINSKT